MDTPLLIALIALAAAVVGIALAATALVRAGANRRAISDVDRRARAASHRAEDQARGSGELSLIHI